MNLSRSAFLKLCATAFVGLSTRSPMGELVLQAATPATDVLPASMSGRFDWAAASAAMFLPHVHSVFTTGAADGSTTVLALDQVVEATCDPVVEQFSLVFRSSASGTLHGLHTIRHDALGEFELFIAPVGGGQGPVATYEACFSRLHQRAVHHG